MVANQSCAFVCLPVTVRTIKPKTAKTKIAKLGTQIVHHDTSLTNEYNNKPTISNVSNIRSKVKVIGLGLGDRVAGVSYAPIECFSIVHFVSPEA